MADETPPAPTDAQAAPAPQAATPDPEPPPAARLTPPGVHAADTPGAAPFSMPAFTPGADGSSPTGMDLLADVNLNVKIELGRTRMLVEDVLRLGEGSVVELDKLAGDPVDVYVNDRPVARGEVLVLNDNFCIRISEILTNPADPI